MSGRPPRSSTGKTKVVELLERNKNVQVPQRASHTLPPFPTALCEGLWARALMTVRCLPPVDVQGRPDGSRNEEVWPTKTKVNMWGGRGAG